ncbi:MAG: VOC family protein [Planctomycetota bacterium]
MPSLAVNDLSRATRWYEESLGFDVVFTNGEPVVFAILSRDGVELSLTSAQPDRVGKSAVYLKLEGVDQLYERLRSLDVEMIHTLTDEPYGMRECLFEDLDGNQINLGEPIGSG